MAKPTQSHVADVSRDRRTRVRRRPLARASAEALESRRLLADPTAGWVFTETATRPFVRVDPGTHAVLDPASFRGRHLTGTSPEADALPVALGPDAAGRPRFAAAAGAMPADGNYELSMPRTSFAPAPVADVFVVDFFLNADFNHNRVVDFADLVTLGQNYDDGTDADGNVTGVAPASDRGFSQGDTNGDAASTSST